jgi:cytochrome c biogenesis protein CcmG/thiol:disulfide interchange protein DsbE
MRRWLYFVVGLGVVALIVVEIATAGGNDGTGRPAYPLPAKVLQGPRVTLADLKGKPALINFWASWCEPCGEEAPEVARLSRSLHGQATVVGIDYTDSEDRARSFLRQYGWTFPVLSDPDGVYGGHYAFSGLPTTIVLDSEGRIAATLHGPQSVSSFRRALDAADANRS